MACKGSLSGWADFSAQWTDSASVQRYGIVAPPSLGNYQSRGGNELRRMQGSMNHLWRGFGTGTTDLRSIDTCLSWCMKKPSRSNYLEG